MLLHCGDQSESDIMPALQQMVLTDRQTPAPVTMTLIPNGKTSGEFPFFAVAENRSIEMERSTYSIQVRKVPGKRKVRLIFRMPLVQTETINGISFPKQIHELTWDALVTLPRTSSEAERNNFVGLVQSSLASTNSLIHDVLVKGQEVW